MRIIVSESHDLRRQMVHGIALSSVVPFALGLPVLLLLWLSIKRGLLPLVELSREITLRTPQTLLEFDEKNAPREVRPIIAALNDLMRRITHTLDNERRFTANAAHELRTPLAAIQAHLFIARHTSDQAQRQRAMTQLQHGVDRGIRLVGQLLTLARLDPAQSLPDATAVDVETVAQAVCAELAPLALQRDQTLELLLTPGLPSLTGNADMLAMLLCNLLDNAIRYTQRGGHINITAGACATGLQVAVQDNGPGIAAAERVQVFERFYRIARDEVGSGLGLSICKRIAELHHATLTLEDGLQNCGLTVRVNFSA